MKIFATTKNIDLIKYLKLVLLFSFFLTILTACKTVEQLPDPLTAGWNNKPVCKLLEENKNMRVLKCTFIPGAGHERHYHAPHFGYALSGGMFRIKDNNGIREVILATGSHFTSKGVEWHEVLNIGNSTAIYLIFEPK